MTTLVIGAGGHVGGGVVTQLLEAGERVRAASRNPDTAGLPAGVEAVAMDLTVPDSLAPALRGARKVFTYAHPDAMADLVRAALDAGVEHLVLLSSIAAAAADPEANAIVRHHALSERAIMQSPLPWTFIRPGAFATNATWWAPSIKAEGVARIPFPDGHATPIHEYDIAAVAVRALTESDHEGSSYWLTGPESISQRAQVEAIADAIGKPVRLQEVPPESAGPEYPPLLLRHLAEAQGRPEEISPVTEQLLGREGVTFARWAVDHVDGFR
jgi:uncharacterized protein YbjT (DUF2867 family)